jgi:Tfp pilus assembly PilM family ATPase
MQVLLVAAKKDMVLSFSDLIREAGLQPTVVDVDSFAAQNAIEANVDLAPDQVVAILNVGAAMTNIDIVQGGVPYFTAKDLQVGGDAFVEAVQRRHNLSHAEAAAAVRGEAGAGLEDRAGHRAGRRGHRHGARSRAGLPAHRGRGRATSVASCCVVAARSRRV